MVEKNLSTCLTIGLALVLVLVKLGECASVCYACTHVNSCGVDSSTIIKCNKDDYFCLTTNTTTSYAGKSVSIITKTCSKYCKQETVKLDKFSNYTASCCNTDLCNMTPAEAPSSNYLW